MPTTKSSAIAKTTKQPAKSTRAEATRRTTQDDAAPSPTDNAAADAGTWWSNRMLGNSIPAAPPKYMTTTSTRLVLIGVHASLKTGHITLVDGDFGVGKTTAVVEAARAVSNVEAVYVNMFGVNSPRDALAIIWRAMTGELVRKRVTAAQLREDLIEELKDRKVLLIIDDAHRLKSPSLETLLALWNRVHNDTRRGVPMIFVGNRLEKHLGSTVPELISRSGALVEAKPLLGKEAATFLTTWEPGIAGTDPNLLVGINARYFRGQIRNWEQFFDMLRVFRDQKILDGVIDEKEAKDILELLPTTGVN